MAKKYIIEKDDNESIWSIYADKDGDATIEGVSLIPYTEDSAYAHGYTEAESKFREIRDELEKQAYQKGHQDAYDTAYKDAEEIYESGKRAMYQKGMKDAWECARKINCLPSSGGIENYVLGKIFGHTSNPIIMEKFSASEAIKKIRQYEEKWEEQIQVGDEVKNTQTDARFIVTHMWVNNSGEKGVSGFNYECSAFSTALELVRKTGRHFPEIAEVLQKMKEK